MAKLHAGREEQIVSLEHEFLVTGGKMSCSEVLLFIKEHFPTWDFDGKCSGFFTCDTFAENPVLFKINGDGPSCSDNLVLECALPETNAPGAAWLTAEYIYPFLGRLEEMMKGTGLDIGFLASTHDLQGHRAACQFNASISRTKSRRDLYHAIVPALVTLPCLTGPGGPTPEGYVRSVRMTLHCHEFLSSYVTLLPICYPHGSNFGSTLRAHENMEHCRLPGAMFLNLAVLTLVHYAYQVSPQRFSLNLCNPLQAAKTLSRSLDNTTRVHVYRSKSSKSELSGLEIQEEMLMTTESVLHEHGGPGWADRAIKLWRRTIDDVREEKATICSDFQIKKFLINECLEKVGLTLGDAQVQSAYASISKLLHKRIDPEDFFSSRLSLRRALLPGKGLLPFEELKEIYRKSLHEAFQLEIAFAKVGPGNLVNRLSAVKQFSFNPFMQPGIPYLAPRAQKRQELLKKFEKDTSLSASWNRIETSDALFNLGPPELDSYRKEKRPFSERANRKSLHFLNELFFDLFRNGEEQGSSTPEYRTSVGGRHRLQRARQAAAGNRENSMWALQKEYRMHARACAFVRDTIRARSASATRNPVKLDEYTPIVFHLSDNTNASLPTIVQSGNAAHRTMQLRKRRPGHRDRNKPDKVYSIFKAVSKRKFLLEGHLRKDWLSAIAFLYTYDLMEVERYKAITRRARKYQCRLDPREDEDLADFSLDEKMIAWAVKYASEMVIVVSGHTWNPSESLEQFVDERKVTIETLPLSSMPPGIINRLTHMHFISALLKNRST